MLYPYFDGYISDKHRKYIPVVPGQAGAEVSKKKKL